MTDFDITQNDCGNCECYGFPCLNCAEYVHNGELGPGFNGDGVRVIPSDTPTDIRTRMRDFIYPKRDNVLVSI